MTIIAATIYWVIVAIWAIVLVIALYNFFTNRIVYGTARLLIVVVVIDTIRDIVENTYFGAYFGSQYGLFDKTVEGILGQPVLLLMPKIMNVVAGCAVLFILLLRWLPSAAQERNTLGRLATVDGMTGLINRRHFLILAETECERAKRYGRPLSMLMLDIDHFKSVNDRFGHDIGDQVIVLVAATCQKMARDSDVVARLGGEEFAILLPETPLEDAALLAERLRAAVSAIRMPLTEGELEVRVSIGMSEYHRSGTLADLMKKADIALYDAKRSGRDRVCRFAAA